MPERRNPVAGAQGILMSSIAARDSAGSLAMISVRSILSG